MHQAAFERYGMSPDTHGGLERSQDQADALIDALPEPLRNQVAASLAPRKTLAQRVQEDQRTREFDSHTAWIADTIAVADRLREPEVKERVLAVLTTYGISLAWSLELTDALLGGRHEQVHA
jgi:hypothetical protein